MNRWQRYLSDHHHSFDARGRARAFDARGRARGLVDAPEHSANAACVDLGDYDVLILDGKDAHTFLQGYLTCDVAKLGPERALPGAFCNLQGRVVADVVLASAGGVPWMSVHGSLVAPLEKSLAKYLQFSRSKLRASGDDHVTLGLLAAFGDATPTLPATPFEATAFRGGIAVRAPGTPPRWLAILPFDAACELWARAADESRIDDAGAWDLSDVRSRWARVTAATSETFLPQMLGLTEHGAVSFEKGCYLGQEIVARAEHLGTLKRRLASTAWRGAQLPSAGESLLDQRDRAVGTVIVAAQTASDAGEALVVIGETAAGAAHTASGITFDFP